MLDRGTLIHWWNDKQVQLLWKSMWLILKKAKVDVPYYPGVCVPLHRMYLKELIPYDRDTC